MSILQCWLFGATLLCNPLATTSMHAFDIAPAFVAHPTWIDRIFASESVLGSERRLAAPAYASGFHIFLTALSKPHSHDFSEEGFQNRWFRNTQMSAATLQLIGSLLLALNSVVAMRRVWARTCLAVFSELSLVSFSILSVWWLEIVTLQKLSEHLGGGNEALNGLFIFPAMCLVALATPFIWIVARKVMILHRHQKIWLWLVVAVANAVMSIGLVNGYRDSDSLFFET